MKDLMIDIETLGLVPGSVIASIGVVQFDRMTREIGEKIYLTIDIVDAQKAGLTIDASTVRWWLNQSKDAQQSTFVETGMTLTNALYFLSHDIERLKPERIWAHSPSFDLVHLEAAYRTVGQQIPWNHRQPRDTRTLLELAGIKVGPVGVLHNALEDAIAQATAVIDAYTIVAGKPPLPAPIAD